MKQIKRRLINILNKELFIDKSQINENTRLEKNLNSSDFNLLLYYFERDTNIRIPDDNISLSQSLNEFASSIYQVKKYNTKLVKA